MSSDDSDVMQAMDDSTSTLSDDDNYVRESRRPNTLPVPQALQSLSGKLFLFIKIISTYGTLQ